MTDDFCDDVFHLWRMQRDDQMAVDLLLAESGTASTYSEAS